MTNEQRRCYRNNIGSVWTIQSYLKDSAWSRIHQAWGPGLKARSAWRPGPKAWWISDHAEAWRYDLSSYGHLEMFLSFATKTSNTLWTNSCKILFELRVWRSFEVTILRTVTLRRSPCTRIFRAWLPGVQVTSRRRWWFELSTSPSALVRNPDLLPVLVLPQATIESKYLSPMPLKPSSKIPPFLQPCLSQARPLFKAVLFIFLSSFSASCYKLPMIRVLSKTVSFVRCSVMFSSKLAKSK